MKTLYSLISVSIFCLLTITLRAQQPPATKLSDLPTVRLLTDNTVHFLSPQPIKYVDISSHLIKGDLPVENLLRIKLLGDSAEKPLAIQELGELGTLTIVGEDFISQFRLVKGDNFMASAPSLIELSPDNTRPIDNLDEQLPASSMREIGLNMIKKRESKALQKAKEYGITMQLNKIATFSDFIFLDISFLNTTNLAYHIDEFRLFIEDKKIIKANNFQSIEIFPVWKLKELEYVKNKQRNIYVIKKAVFPGSKVLRLSLSEKQISGRMLDLKVSYKDILQAESL